MNVGVVCKVSLSVGPMLSRFNGGLALPIASSDRPAAGIPVFHPGWRSRLLHASVTHSGSVLFPPQNLQALLAPRRPALW